MPYRLAKQLTLSVTSSGVDIPVSTYLPAGAVYSLTFEQASGSAMYFVAPGGNLGITGTAVPSGAGQGGALEGLRVVDGDPAVWILTGTEDLYVDIYEWVES